MKQQQKNTAAVSFDFTFKPIKTPRKSILFEAPLQEFKILNFVNGDASICKIYIENDDALKPFLEYLQPSNVYDVYCLDNPKPFASVLVFQKNNIINYTVKSTIMNIETKKIEKQNNNNLI